MFSVQSYFLATDSHQILLVTDCKNKTPSVLLLQDSLKSFTGKSFSEALILESKYDERLFIDFPEKIQVHTMLYTNVNVIECQNKTKQKKFCTQHVVNLYFLGIQ